MFSEKNMQRLKSLFEALALGAVISAGCACSRPELCDSQATEATRNLYKRIEALAELGVMFGHQDDMMYGHAWAYEEGRSDVKECCGSYPAVFGWDLGGIETDDSVNLDGVPFDKIRSGIAMAHSMGAINTVSIHMRNPVTFGSSWDSKSTTTVADILPGAEFNARYASWLGKAASFLKSIKDADGNNVPLIFRPLHENSGGAFWWGCLQCTPEEYQALWKYSVAYLRDSCGLHNVIYMYSSDVVRDKEDFMSRYPGDRWVDMLGIDAYHRQQDWDYKSGCENMLGMLATVGKEHKKPYAFSETGLESVPDPEWWTKWLLPAISGKGLSYVLVWRNSEKMPEHFFGPWKGCVSEEDFRRFAMEANVLMLNDIQ